mgnify:CR=1 FL=1
MLLLTANGEAPLAAAAHQSQVGLVAAEQKLLALGAVLASVGHLAGCLAEHLGGHDLDRLAANQTAHLGIGLEVFQAGGHRSTACRGWVGIVLRRKRLVAGWWALTLTGTSAAADRSCFCIGKPHGDDARGLASRLNGIWHLPGTPGSLAPLPRIQSLLLQKTSRATSCNPR